MTTLPMTSLSYLKDNAYDLYKQLYKTNESFRQFAMDTYRFLDSMKPGKYADLSKYDPEKLAWFRIAAMVYIQEGQNFLLYCFDESYTIIIREHEHGFPVKIPPPRTDTI